MTLVIGLAVLGAGCSNIGEGIANQVLEDQGIEVDLDEGSVSVQGPDGQTITAGSGLPQGFPADFPLPDGAEVQGSVSGFDEQFDIVASFEVPSSVADVTDFYRSALPQAGYTITQDISGADRSNTVLSIEGGGLTGDVIVNPLREGVVQLAVTLDDLAR